MKKIDFDTEVKMSDTIVNLMKIENVLAYYYSNINNDAEVIYMIRNNISWAKGKMTEDNEKYEPGTLRKRNFMNKINNHGVKGWVVYDANPNYKIIMRDYLAKEFDRLMPEEYLDKLQNIWKLGIKFILELYCNDNKDLEIANKIDDIIENDYS